MIDGLIISTKQAQNNVKHLAFAAVAVPGERDTDGEILTEDEIEYAAHKFLEKYRIVDPDHVCQFPGKCKNVATPVESYITPVEQAVKTEYGENLTLPKGTWIIGLHIEDNKTWESVVKGERRGVSLTGISATGSAGKSLTPKRTLIRDLGDKWEAKTVSIVKAPAVPKAKFFAIKQSNGSEKMEENNEPTVVLDEESKEAFKSMTKLSAAFKSIFQPNDNETGDYATKAELQSLKEEIGKNQEETLNAIKAITPPTNGKKKKGGCKSEGLTPEEQKQLDALLAKKKGTATKEEDEEPEDEEIEDDEGRTAGKSQQLNPFIDDGGEIAIKGLYDDDGRDGYGCKLQ